MNDANVVKKGDIAWDRLYSAWKSDKKDAGYLVIGTEQYRVIANDSDNVLFVRTGGGIDGNYSSLTGGIPR